MDYRPDKLREMARIIALSKLKDVENVSVTKRSTTGGLVLEWSLSKGVETISGYGTGRTAAPSRPTHSRRGRT